MKRKSSVSNVFQIEASKPLLVVDEMPEHRDFLMSNYARKRAETITGSYYGSPMARNNDTDKKKLRNLGTSTLNVSGRDLAAF
jgi:hypothetical protein